MLSENYRQPYVEFQQVLQQLQPISNTSELRGSEAQAALQTLQQLFQQMLSLDWEQIDPGLSAKVQSIHIEINKQLRLLSMDMVFLKSARETATAIQRQRQIQGRVELLMRYCEGILGDGEKVDGE